jgi:hypothetical protein
MKDYIHSLFKPKFNVVDELNRLSGELRIIGELKSIAQSKGWGHLKRWVIDKVVQYDQSIVTLCSDVEKNYKEIEHKRCFRDSLLWFVGQLDDKIKAEPEIQQRMKYFAETAHDLDPMEVGESVVEL